MVSVIRATRSELPDRARPGHFVFMLRALAAGEMRHERKTSCCRAAEHRAIRAGGSMDQAANLQVADKTANRTAPMNVLFAAK